MSQSCCDSKSSELTELAKKQKRVLWIILIINLVMFFIEGYYGLIAQSVSLLADSLDMLGDAFVYGISLYAIGRSARWNARVSFVKGLIMAAFGTGVVVNAVQRFLSSGLPLAETMGWVGALALAANMTCAGLLLRRRKDNINMRSVWLCSRNDVIANSGVLLAAGLVALTQSKYPDLIVGLIIAAIVLRSAFTVLSESVRAHP